MSLTRAQLVTAVAAELAGPITLGGFAATDTSGSLKESVDHTFRALGVVESGLAAATVADGDEQKALAYLTYFVYAKAVTATTNKMPVAAGSAKAGLERQHDNLRAELARVLANAQHYGLSLPGNGQSGIVPVPFGGGISSSDYEARATDADRVPPLFSLDDLTGFRWEGV